MQSNVYRDGTNKTADGIESTIDRTIDGAQSKMHEFGDNAAKKGKEALRAAEDVAKDLKGISADVAELLKRRVIENPLAAVGFSALAGAILWNLIFRR